MVVEVIMNRTAKKLNRTFDYNVPRELEDQILVGSTVLVPFGNAKKLEEAFIVSIKDNSTFELKDIADVKNDLSDKQIELARWMAKKYYCNVSDCIKLMLAPGTKTKNQENRIGDKLINVVYLKKDIEQIEYEIEAGVIKSDKHKRILRFLKDNEGCTISEIEDFTDCSRAIVKTLEKNEYIEIVEQKVERNPLENKEIEKTTKLELTEEQALAFRVIQESIEEEYFEKYLIHGITGSRKNRSISSTNTRSIREG